MKENESGEIIDKVVAINRVSKAHKGGKKMAFTALVIAGDGRSKVGCGLGRANEVADAIRKGANTARKNMMEVPLKGTTIPHEVIGEFSAARVMLKPACEGTGVIAGSSVRAICELAGIKDILTKSLRSDNVINVAKATIAGLKALKKHLEIKEEIEKLKTGNSLEGKQEAGEAVKEGKEEDAKAE
ncbi:MAG: 30S ribosomal protein S5 [Candidatus Omnitrophica bacterium]|nr:30S ribosomal protein S5 [Candidatus Omnitrophota bacterium]